MMIVYGKLEVISLEKKKKHQCCFFLVYFNCNVSCIVVEDSGDSQSESENSVSDSVDDNDDSVAEISRSFRSRQELCEQLNVNHMIQRIYLITLDNSKFKWGKSAQCFVIQVEPLCSTPKICMPEKTYSTHAITMSSTSAHQCYKYRNPFKISQQSHFQQPRCFVLE